MYFLLKNYYVGAIESHGTYLLRWDSERSIHMNWNFLITFGIGLGVYFVGLGIFTLIKYLRNKKRLEKEIEEQKSDEEEQK